MTSKSVRPFSDFLWALAGPITWAAHFFLIYGVEAAVCTRASSPALVMRGIVAGATLLALGALAVFLVRMLRQRRHASEAASFLPAISAILALVSMAAIAAAALAGLTLPACTPPAG